MSGGLAGTLWIWDQDGQLVGRPLTRHDSALNAVAVGRLRDQGVIVSAADDHTVRKSGTSTAETRNDSPPMCLAAAPHPARAARDAVVASGHSIISLGTWDGTAHVFGVLPCQARHWPTPSGDCRPEERYLGAERLRRR